MIEELVESAWGLEPMKVRCYGGGSTTPVHDVSCSSGALVNLNILEVAYLGGAPCLDAGLLGRTRDILTLAGHLTQTPTPTTLEGLNWFAYQTKRVPQLHSAALQDAALAHMEELRSEAAAQAEGILGTALSAYAIANSGHWSGHLEGVLMLGRVNGQRALVNVPELMEPFINNLAEEGYHVEKVTAEPAAAKEAFTLFDPSNAISFKTALEMMAKL